MGKDSTFRVIRPDGVRSKPTTAERIIEMYRSSNLSEDSVIREEGSSFDMPVGVFVDMHSVGTTPQPKPKHTTFVPAEKPTARADSDKGYSPLKPMKPKPSTNRRWWRHDDEHLDLIGGLMHFLLFRGMKTPRDDRNKTSAYLSGQLNWLERYVKLLHFFNVLYIWLILIGLAKQMFDNRQWLVQIIQRRGVWEGVQELLPHSYRYLWFALGFLALFFFMMVSEALLRLVPACLRHWMAINNNPNSEQA